MSIFTTIHRLALEWVAGRRAARAERFISDLPAEVRKDIGWPSPSRLSRRARVAPWTYIQ